jgi:acyl carrier protein
MEAIDKLKSAFQESMALGPNADFGGVEYGKTQGWDSVAHMALIAHIESQFDIMLETDDVIGMSSFGRAKEILGKYGLTFG